MQQYIYLIYDKKTKEIVNEYPSTTRTGALALIDRHWGMTTHGVVEVKPTACYEPSISWTTKGVS